VTRFRFRLQRVLGVRRVEEEIARAEWLDAERTAREAEDQARRTQDAVDAARLRLAAVQSQGMLRPAEVLVLQAQLDRLREQWVQRTIVASRSRRDAERLRQVMAERRVRVRGLETLEDRARETWRSETEARANAELDERGDRRNPLRSLGAAADETRATRGTWS
jgi:flagellar export protein FliJ